MLFNQDLSIVPAFFMAMMKERPWFDMNSPEPISPDGFFGKSEYTADEMLQYIFAIIFGAYGFEKDLDRAEVLILDLLENIVNDMPLVNRKRDNERWMLWQNGFASASVLLGTVYAIREEYIKAVYHFIRALKTEAIGLSRLYCDYILYCSKKLLEMPCEELNPEGWGYSKDMPMGSTLQSGGDLDASFAPLVISSLEGTKGKVIAYFRGRSHGYGHLERLGSTSGASSKHMIDIYETFVIDKEYRLYKVRFYFNGYIPKWEKPEIRVPVDCLVVPHSLVREWCELL